MSRDVNKLLSEIDKLPIYSKDYKIINNIIENGDPKLFTVILESVLDGDIYWSDFEEILSNTNYNNIVVSTLDSQELISKEYSKILALRKELWDNLDFNLPENLALGLNTDNEEFYNSEFNNTLENMLYNLIRVTPNDTDLSILCKIKLLNHIVNYEEGKDNGINPEDIFFFINDFLIPVDSRYQVLNSTDISFMHQNNLTKEQMKKYKALAYFLRKKDFEVDND